VAEEVQGIFRGLGVETSWRTGGNFGGGEVPEVPVILLSRDPMAGRRGVLGLVVRDQEPQRAVWLFGAAVREVLSPAPSGLQAVNPDVLDRALARIAAHEIVHAIAPEAPHARDGLMRHALSRQILVGARPAIDARCASTFVTQLSLEWQRRLSSLGAAARPRP
jgi:hypothetical protein